MKACPCGSGLAYIKCCKPFLTGTATPKTAVALMRSRYTAYSKAKIDYIEKTMCKQASLGFNPTEAKTWAESVKWQKLDVLETTDGEASDQIGTVTFCAHFTENGTRRTLTEKSSFEKINGQWFYTDGSHRHQDAH